MPQYKAIKAKYPDAVLLFRVGDFYEAFNEDAKTAALHLKVTLVETPDGEDVKASASLPHYAVDNALRQLVKAGYRVALCEPLEGQKPQPMRRGVTDVFRPDRA